MARNVPRMLAATLLGAAALALLQVGIAADPPNEKQAQPAVAAQAKQAAKPQARILASTETLGGKTRYLTHISTDKPIYRGGEKVYVRGVLLEAHDHRPLDEKIQANAMVEVLGPKGDQVASGWTRTENSSLGFSWPVPDGQAGGEYTVKITYPNHGYPAAERKFDIRAYRAPRLKSQIVFVRDGYGPGDEVAATLHVERAEGGIPTGAKVTAIARVDGAEVFNAPVAEVDEEGNARAAFKLPAEIERGEGTLALVIEDGGIVETASKTIPILLQTVDLNLYPEGGDLVAGLANRVYFEARTPAQKPADLAGLVVDAEGNEVAKFRSEHEGRGRFEFTPTAEGKYSLKITEPSGIKKLFPLPEIKSQGVVLRANENRTAAGQPVVLQIASSYDDTFKVTLTQRELEVASSEVEVAAGKSSELKLEPKESGDGVLIATVWDLDGRPLAERLVFRAPKSGVQVTVEADQSQYLPGGQAQLKIKTTDAAGKPISAVVGMTVTDDSVLEMIEKREQAPRLPVMVLLEGDVRELADAHLYLDAEDQKAPLAVDLLLGTQGWRRFSFVDTAQFLAQHGDAGRRVLALQMATRREMLRGFGGGEGGAIVEKELLEARIRAVAAPVDEAIPRNAPEPNARPEAPQLKAPVPAEQDKQKKDAERAPAAAREPQEDANREQLRRALQQADQAVAGDRAFAAKPMAKRFQQPFVVVREYAHQVRADRQQGDRVDFTETLFWHAGIKTNEAGEATVKFGLSDSVTSFRVTADAFGSDGALGTSGSLIESVEPFYIEPKLPLEVTSGDLIELPIGIVNATTSKLDATQLSVTAGNNGQVGSYEPFTLAAGERSRRLFRINVGKYTGPTELTFSGKSGPYADQVTRPLKVVPLGFPVEFAAGGTMYADSTSEHQIQIPADVVPGSITTTAAVYPTPLANMTSALERLIREPHGCFEQTSSSTYPLVMAQQYFMSHTGVDPSLIERSKVNLDKGYDRLIGFECKQHGYEWFAADPGHEALTAYGLLEFTDMSEVRQVDTQMLDRTRTWLLKARDGNGSYERKRRALHTWLTDPEVSNAYITWALIETGATGLDQEVAWLKKNAETSKNSYAVALTANVLWLTGDEEGSRKLMDKLMTLQSEDGTVTGATQSIVGSGGEALKIETTSLAALAWLRDPDYADAVFKAMQYLSSACKNGRFGSTQSTILALRAIVAYDKSLAKPKAAGSLQLLVDGKSVGEPVKFDTDMQGTIGLPNFAQLLTPGAHKVEVRMDGGSSMPYSVAVNYHNTKPDSSAECNVDLEVKLADAVLDEGSITEAQVRVTNTSDEAIPTPVAIIGIPGGLEVRHDQLKELVKAEQIAAYEVIGREVVLYWRDLDAAQTVELPLSLVAALPGSYTGPASRSYLYYTDEYKSWVAGLSIRINPLNQ